VRDHRVALGAQCLDAAFELVGLGLGRSDGVGLAPLRLGLRVGGDLLGGLARMLERGLRVRLGGEDRILGPLVRGRGRGVGGSGALLYGLRQLRDLRLGGLVLDSDASGGGLPVLGEFRGEGRGLAVDQRPVGFLRCLDGLPMRGERGLEGRTLALRVVGERLLLITDTRRLLGRGRPSPSPAASAAGLSRPRPRRGADGPRTRRRRRGP